MLVALTIPSDLVNDCHQRQRNLLATRADLALCFQQALS